MSGKGMTPREAASAVIAAMPTGFSEAQLQEYGIEATAERAQAVTRAMLSLNLFWIFAAIEAHIPQKFQQAVSELVLHAVETGWGTTYPVGPAAWTAFLTEWKERTKRYERLVKEGMSPLAISAEVGMWLEEQHVVGEEDRRSVLTLLIDSVPVESYGQLLQDAS
jgi:hypothetical protein